MDDFDLEGACSFVADLATDGLAPESSTRRAVKLLCSAYALIKDLPGVVVSLDGDDTFSLEWRQGVVFVSFTFIQGRVEFFQENADTHWFSMSIRDNDEVLIERLRRAFEGHGAP